jgi:O-antigen/teichoic acid export membrane protein
MNSKKSNTESSYRQIMKATSIFGGVQVINIIIQIIRSKVVAVLLGPTGMGIMGLLNATIGFIASLTGFGLNTSAVKDIAAANGLQNNYSISLTVTVLRRLVLITGALGAILVLFLSPWLSQLTFGNKDYTLAFVWLSLTLLFMQLSSGQLVILQGMRKLHLLAKANVLGNTLGLLVSLPLYYIYRIDGIVPGIIGTSLITLLLSWYFSRKVTIKKIKISYRQTFSEGKTMLSMGFFISISSFLAIGASYIVRLFISRIGSIDQVGLYAAGFAIINTYVGLIFTAMGTDYYPRLSAVTKSNQLSKEIVNQQAEIALLIMAPILIGFLVFINGVIIIMYSNEFIAVNTMIYWAALGMFFKIVSWCVSYLFLAKGAGKLFFWNELITNSYLLFLNLLGYYYFGLTGLGLSFLVSYFLYFVQVYIVAKIKFKFSYDLSFQKIFVVQFSLAVASFLTVKFINYPYNYSVGMIFLLTSLYYSFCELDKRLGLKILFQNFKNKF